MICQEYFFPYRFSYEIINADKIYHHSFKSKHYKVAKRNNARHIHKYLLDNNLPYGNYYVNERIFFEDELYEEDKFVFEFQNEYCKLVE